jgi:hypothetical protein
MIHYTFSGGWPLLAVVQALIGAAIAFAGFLLLMIGMDKHTPWLTRGPVIGLVGWGMWFAALPLEGKHDSAAANALAGLVAFVLIRHGRQIRGILDGEAWWPGARLVELKRSSEKPRLTVKWYRKLNPIWILFGNEDDGIYGDDGWRAGRDKTFGLAVKWWLRNPLHNLMFYVIGVGDRDRVVVGPWAPDFHRPDGGLLWCVTIVHVLGLPIPLPFVSYLGGHLKAYIGWRPSGAFGVKLNILRQQIEVHP